MFLRAGIDPLIMRITLEKVGGEYQGACYPFMRRDELKGSNRLIFHPTDGSLYVGTTDRGWSRGPRGLHHTPWTRKPVFDIKEMSLAKDGFTITFTQPIDPTSAADVKS